MTPRSVIQASVSSVLFGLLIACAATSPVAADEDGVAPAAVASGSDASEKPSPVTTQPWQEAVISVSDIDRTALFFQEFGDYETVWQGEMDAAEKSGLGLPSDASASVLVLRSPATSSGYLRLIQFENAGAKVPTRPGARAWDTGCFWSVMVRVKGMESLYFDAVDMGWWTETPIAPLSFAGSELQIVVFKGPDGVQVQGYERMNRAIPEGFPDFERVSRPFNIMQMTRDRDVARRLMVDVLGFDTQWFGAPYVDEAPTVMPLGIPQNLTTSIPYKAGIFRPPGQTLYGRMEYIEIDGLDGFDYADRCNAPNLGILGVSYPVDDAQIARDTIVERGWTIESEPAEIVREPYGQVLSFRIKAPDGGNIEFFEVLN